MKTISRFTQYSMGVNQAPWKLPYTRDELHKLNNFAEIILLNPQYFNLLQHNCHSLKFPCTNWSLSVSCLYIYRFYQHNDMRVRCIQAECCLVYTVCTVYTIHSSFWSSTFQSKPISSPLKTSVEIQQRMWSGSIFINLISWNWEVDPISTQLAGIKRWTIK